MVRLSSSPLGSRSSALLPDPPCAAPRAASCAESTSAVTVAHAALPRSSLALPSSCTRVQLACFAPRDACSLCISVAPSACMHSCLGRLGIPRRRPSCHSGKYMACAPGTSLSRMVPSSSVYAVTTSNPRARYQAIASVLPVSTSSWTTPTLRPCPPPAPLPSLRVAAPCPRHARLRVARGLGLSRV